MSDFFTSDHHFYHNNIIKYARRPFANYTEMNAALIQRWNEVVGSGDRVFFLGDFSMHANRLILEDLIKKLNGHKVLIRGNHDMKLTCSQWRKRGFEEAYDELEHHIGDFHVLLRHYPMPIADIPAKFDAIVHGHTHAYRPCSPRNVCVCVEATDYRPIGNAQLITLLQGMATKYRTMVSGKLF